jgi:hypothetical protein
LACNPNFAECLGEHCETNGFDDTRKVQKDILDTYVLDFAKHADKNEVMKTHHFLLTGLIG